MRTKLKEMQEKYGHEFWLGKSLPWAQGYDTLFCEVAYKDRMYKQSMRVATAERMSPEILEVMAEALDTWAKKKKGGKII